MHKRRRRAEMAASNSNLYAMPFDIKLSDCKNINFTAFAMINK